MHPMMTEDSQGTPAASESEVPEIQKIPRPIASAKDVPIVRVFGSLEKFINERSSHADDESGNNVSFVIDPVKRTTVNQNVTEHTSAESRRKSDDKTPTGRFFF